MALASRAWPRSSGCPPLADLLLALAAEFHDVDPAAADTRLDELALPLFGLAGGDHRTAAGRLADVLDSEPGFDADRTSVSALWLDHVLRDALRPPADPRRARGRGRAAGRASTVHVLSAPTGWYAGLADGERLWLVDATMDGRRADPWSLRPHCAHELAFAALMGLSDRFERAGDTRQAGRAALLRSRLPLRG